MNDLEHVVLVAEAKADEDLYDCLRECKLHGIEQLVHEGKVYFIDLDAPETPVVPLGKV